MLGLPYPGGVEIDKLAKSGDPHAVRFPQVSFKDAPFDFSFSGVKTAIINYVHTASQRGQSINAADIAASYSEAITGVLTEKFYGAAKALGFTRLAVAAECRQILCSGKNFRAVFQAAASFLSLLFLFVGITPQWSAHRAFMNSVQVLLQDLTKMQLATTDIQKALCKPNKPISF